MAREEPFLEEPRVPMALAWDGSVVPDEGMEVQLQQQVMKSPIRLVVFRIGLDRPMEWLSWPLLEDALCDERPMRMLERKPFVVPNPVSRLPEERNRKKIDRLDPCLPRDVDPRRALARIIRPVSIRLVSDGSTRMMSLRMECPLRILVDTSSES